MKRFDAAEVDVFERMIEAMVIDRDVAAFRKVIEDVGLLRPGMPFDDQQVEDYFGHFYEFVLEDQPQTMTPEYATESVRRIFDASGPSGEIIKAANVPPSFVIIQRINMGLYAILGQLLATRTGGASPKSCGRSSTDPHPPRWAKRRRHGWQRRRRDHRRPIPMARRDGPG